MWLKDKAKEVWESTKNFMEHHPALTGAVSGAAVGSTVPVVGTVVGAVAGATVGYYVGKDKEIK